MYYTKEGSIKKRNYNLLINYCDKCYAGERPMLKVLKAKGQDKNWAVE